MQKFHEDTSESCRKHKLDAAWLRFAVYWALQLSGVNRLSLVLFEHLICEAIGDADLPPDTQHLGLAMQGSLVLSRR